MSDLIERQAAIDAVRRSEALDMAFGYGHAVDALRELPSAELATNLQPNLQPTCNFASDCISRQAVYNVLDKMPIRGFKKDGETIHGLISLSQVNSAIINLPSAQPHSNESSITQKALDTISRQAVQEIAEHSDWFCSSDDFNDFLWALYALPSAQPEQRWIPCSERLPEEYGEYRITWTTSCSKKRFIGDAEYENISFEWDAEQDRFKGEWILEDYIKYYPDVKVIAWKPFEEPYAERKTDEKENI